jgi:hypothetical protein
VASAAVEAGSGVESLRPGRPALLFFSSGFVSVMASMGARNLSQGTALLNVSSGSPFNESASSLRSISKKPACRMRFPHASADAG